MLKTHPKDGEWLADTLLSFSVSKSSRNSEKLLRVKAWRHGKAKRQPARLSWKRKVSAMIVALGAVFLSTAEVLWASMSATLLTPRTLSVCI